MTEFYILDRKERIISNLLPIGTPGNNIYFDDEYSIDVTTGAETLTFKTHNNTPEATYLKIGNYIAFRDNDDRQSFKLFQIVRSKELHKATFTIEIYAETAGVELLNDITRPFSSPSQNVKQFLTQILSGTRYNVGYVDPLIATTLDVDIKEHTKTYNLLQEYVVKQFNTEISYRFEVKGNRIVGRYIDVFRQRGNFKGFRFDYDTNMTEIERSVDTTNLVTALIGVGKNGLTFRELEEADKPLNQDFIEDFEAYQIWNVKGKNILDVFKFDTDNPNELLIQTRKELEKRCKPKFKYSLNVELLGQKVSIGDTVYVVDNSFYPVLHLSARVSQLKISFTDPGKSKCILSNYKEIKSKIKNNSFDGSIEDFINSKFPVGSGDIQSGAITSDKIQTGAVSTPHISDGAIISDKISANQIKAEHILANQIKTEHIQADSIDAEKIKADAINADKIQANSIKSEHIQSEVIESTHIKADQILGDHILADQIDSNHIKANSIVSDKIQANAINAGHITAEAITSEKIQADAIGTNHLQANSINSEKIKANAITAREIKADSIDTEHLKANSITSDKIEANAIKSDKIEADSILGSHITAGAISSEKIDANAIEANHIKANTIEARHLTLSELITDSAQIKTGIIGNAHITDASITGAKIAEASITNANIVDATISGAKIALATIDGANIKEATITNANIKDLNANKINAGIINTGRIEIQGTQGKLKIKDNRLQVFDNSEIPIERVSVGDVNGDGTVYGLRVRGADGDTILYDENGIYSEGITDGAITNEKIEDNAVDARTLNVDSLFVGDNAFIQRLKAVEIDAGQITTGKISGERIDISGLVSFESLDSDLSQNFLKPEGSNKTWINGGTLYTDSVTADKINIKGIAVEKDGFVNFGVNSDGDVTLSGYIQSRNFNNTPGFESGYLIKPDGTAILNEAQIRGSLILPRAGVSNDGNIRFYAGSDYKDRENAPFIIYDDGTLKALKGYFQGTFTGAINVGNIHIQDTDSSEASFVINNNDETKTIIALQEKEAKFSTNFNIDDKVIYNIETNNLTSTIPFILQSDEDSNLYEVTGNINLRLEPSWSGTGHRLSKTGEILEVIEIVGDWATVNDKGTTCYAPANYLKKLEFMNGKVRFNEVDKLQYNIIGSSNNNGGIHKMTYKANESGFTFESSGNTSIVEGDKESYDFKFARKNAEETVNVRVEGNLKVSNKVSFNDKSKIELVSVEGANSGVDFMIR